jgi:mono/diheme cytochrome c family protein
LVGAVTGAVVAVLFGLFALPELGVFGMSATGDSGVLDWWGDTNWRSSLSWRAPDEMLPATADANAAFEHYQGSCIHCHGAPGVSPDDWAGRMRPQPPELWQEGTQDMTDGELFRVVKQGVRMTGMPAFSPEHDDAELWNIVALVRGLENLTLEQTEALKQSVASHHHEEDHG